MKRSERTSSPSQVCEPSQKSSPGSAGASEVKARSQISRLPVLLRTLPPERVTRLQELLARVAVRVMTRGSRGA
jgi:hypothetical protein